MRNFLLVILSLAAFIPGRAQLIDSISGREYRLTESSRLAEDDSEIHDLAEIMPSFPGGQDSLIKFLMASIHYPQDAMNAGIHGTVTVKFVVKNNGSISEVALGRSVYAQLDEEALRVVKSMPAWIPGSIRDQKVNVRKEIPIQFMLLGADVEGELTPELKSTKSLQSFGKGKTLMEEGNYARAEYFFTDALTMLPSVDTYINRGLCRLAQSNEKGYCADLLNASIMGDRESEATFASKCTQYPKDKLREESSGVQQQPSFPGGPDAFLEYLTTNKRYPEAARVNGKSGTVTVSYTVSPKGKIQEVKIEQGICPELDQEALRLVSSMPDWTPGKMNGKFVGVRFNLPVKFD
ncbi:MAG: energy transducer TonB [Bacteroidota bacterium]